MVYQNKGSRQGSSALVSQRFEAGVELGCGRLRDFQGKKLTDQSFHPKSTISKISSVGAMRIGQQRRRPMSLNILALKA